MKKILPILLIINTCFFIVSLAISFTILFRPFYYWQIKTLNLESTTGLNYIEIKEAYDNVLDYTLLNKDFSTGVLKYSDEGKSHFTDCKTLFTINFIVLGLSTIIIILKRKYFNDIKLFKYNISFWSGCLLLSVLLVTTLITIIVGFDKIFTIFHNIFFLGKDNWLFDPTKDEIIKILPQQYFINCAILIVSIISIESVILIIRNLINKKTT